MHLKVYMEGFKWLDKLIQCPLDSVVLSIVWVNWKIRWNKFTLVPRSLCINCFCVFMYNKEWYKQTNIILSPDDNPVKIVGVEINK